MKNPDAKPRRRAPAAPTTPKKGRRRRLAWRILFWLAALGAFGAAAGAAVVVGMFYVYGRDPNLPNIHTLDDYRPKVVTHILSADGKLIGEVFVERRTVVPYEKIPKVLIQAVLCAEDADFFQHGALNYWGLLRAFLKDALSGHARQGGSTITQQVVKTMLLSREKTLRRKVQEIVLARRLERDLTKEQILDLYLNQIDFGGSRYGVEEAARYYFGKDVWDVDLSEATMLASLPQAPERYSPRARNADLVGLKARQRYVLDQMVEHGYVPRAQAEAVARAPIRIIPESAIAPDEGTAPEVVDEVTRELRERYGPEALATLGATVVTTVDTRMEAAARAALEAGLRDLDDRQGYDQPSERLRSDAAVARRLAALRKNGGDAPKVGPVYEAVVIAVDDESDTLTVDTGGARGLVTLSDTPRYNPEQKAASARFVPGDVVHVSVSGAPLAVRNSDGGPLAPMRLELGPQAMLVALDPHTREVRALVGGYGFRPGGFDRALQAARQPGSSFKPILYATAFTTRRYTPATLMDDSPEVYESWRPANAEHEDFRGPVRLRQALALSINTVAIKLLSEIGTQAVQEQARLLGISAPLTSDLSLALGASAVQPLQLVDAYACFDDGGRYLPPSFVQTIDGNAEPRPAPAQAMEPDVAYLLTDVLESTLTEGTAAGARDKLGRPAAGKTGTTNSQRDAWFVGYTPDLVAGAWVGFDDMRPLGHGEFGARAALPIWLDFVRQAEQGRPPLDFDQPPGIVVARIDPQTGLLAQPGDPNALDESFLDGTAPTTLAPPPGTQTPEDYVIEQQGGGR